jgi:2-hydroxycyclohexanecarboxyl-CoA dehydrogenase
MNGAMVVTGGGGGIGRAAALTHARRGLPVAIWDAKLEAAEAARDEMAALGVPALAVEVDVLRPESITDAARVTVDQLGPIAALVTCAGINHFQDFLDITPEDWKQMIDIHLTGTFLAAQAVTPSMRAAGFGRMVFISSLAGLSGSARHVHYGAAKAGIIGFAKALAKELGPDGITVNAIAPGTIDTPMIRNVPPEVHARYAATPVGRIGRVEDVAHVVSMLVSDESSYTTGAVINVNGGTYV